MLLVLCLRHLVGGELRVGLLHAPLCGDCLGLIAGAVTGEGLVVRQGDWQAL